MSAALYAVLDKQEWSIGGPPLIIPGRDPLEDEIWLDFNGCDRPLGPEKYDF